MNEQETKSVLTIALMAAFADGLKDERERAAVKRVADALGPEAGFDLPGLYRDVLLSKPDLAQVASAMQSQESRQLAYEMAVGVCDADGAQGPAEAEFLAKLAGVLNLPATITGNLNASADRVADAAFEPAAPVTGTVLGKANVSAAEMDQMILNASITNAALELLPESIASMAIIPLQLRLVYRIGKVHGYEMDRTHARDFLATLGVGLTGQYLEQFGRRLLGGLLGGIGRQAVSSGLTFATTYALGRVAQRYYAGGRTLDTATLKQTFASLLEEARGLAPRYQGEIERKAGSIDTRSLASLIKQV